MSDPNLSSFIWSVADLLRGDYKQSECGKVILPFTVLRDLDCVYWQGLLDSGHFKNLTEIAQAEGLDKAQVSRTFRLTRLAPDIVVGILAERGNGLTLEEPMRKGVPKDWREQREMTVVE